MKRKFKRINSEGYSTQRGRKPGQFDFMPIYCQDVKSFVHYTCNPPKKEILSENGIVCLGKRFHCSDDREVLLIPEALYIERGLGPDSDKNLVNIVFEKMMRDLS